MIQRAFFYVAEQWALASAYDGMERAQLVVVNVATSEAMQQANGMLQEIGRLRQDKAVFDDVIGRCGSKTPITAVAANIVAERDKGLRKALARVQRVSQKVQQS